MNNKKTYSIRFNILMSWIFWTLFSLTQPPAIRAQVPASAAKSIVILENGRYKPLDSYARVLLKQLSGKSKTADLSAAAWITSALFDPEQRVHDPLFLVTHPDVLQAIAIHQAEEKRRKLSFSDLIPHVSLLRQLAVQISKQPQEKRSLVDNGILLLNENLFCYQFMTIGLECLAPHEEFSIQNPETLKFLNLPADRNSFSIYQLLKAGIIPKTEQLQNQELLETSLVHRELETIYAKIKEWLNYYQDSDLFIIPDENKQTLVSPWQVLAARKTISPFYLPFLDTLEGALIAFRQSNWQQFHTQIKTFNTMVYQCNPHLFSQYAIDWEVFYNGLNPFYKTQFFYGFSFIFFLLSLIFFRKKLAVIAFTLIISGFLLHTAGIVLRMLIMHRPPVTNLYETFVFTSWMSVCLGLLLELFKKRGIGIISSSIAGVILLLIAGKYSLDGDNLGMLSAVLNSNFWLAVHVITISIGFAGIIMSGVAGHVYLLQTTFGKPSIHKLKETFQAIYATQAFGLIFTFLGTVLGGYWADQSWGRFWGWDPKENGALIIILWSAVLFHARKTNWMKDKDFALGSIGGIIAVVLTWFGINLLGVGLHSYGFTTGIAVALLIFLMFEFLFLITAFLKTRALNT